MNDEEALAKAVRAANEWWGSDDEVSLNYPTGEKGIFVTGWIACLRKQEEERSQRSREV